MGEIFNNEGGGLQMKIKQLKKYGMIISFLAVAALALSGCSGGSDGAAGAAGFAGATEAAGVA